MLARLLAFAVLQTLSSWLPCFSGAPPGADAGANPMPLAQVAAKVDSANIGMLRSSSRRIQSMSRSPRTLEGSAGTREKSAWLPATLSYKAPEGELVTVPIRGRTRGSGASRCATSRRCASTSAERHLRGRIRQSRQAQACEILPERRQLRAIHPAGVPAVSHLSADHAGESQGTYDQTHLRR